MQAGHWHPVAMCSRSPHIVSTKSTPFGLADGHLLWPFVGAELYRQSRIIWYGKEARPQVTLKTCWLIVCHLTLNTLSSKSHGAIQPETAQSGWWDSPKWRSDLSVRFFPFRELTPVTSTRNGSRKVEMIREIFQ